MIAIVQVLLLALIAQAAPLDMKPGLWEVSMKLKQDGKEIDPLAELQKQLDKMPEAQKKMILEQMKKASPSSAGGISTVCYTQEMINKPETLSSEDDGDCDYKVKTQTSKKVNSVFNCKNGHSGTMTMEIVNPGLTRVHSISTDKKGKKAEMKYEAKFLKSKC